MVVTNGVVPRVSSNALGGGTLRKGSALTS